MKILLSPAKSISKTTNTPSGLASAAFFLKEAEMLVAKLKKKKASDFQKLMNVSPEIAELNVQRYKNWIPPLDFSEDIQSAVFAFNGEVYKGFDPCNMEEKDLITAQHNVRIISGLYGILKPLDLIYPYRLEMGTKWQISAKHDNLYEFWRKKLTAFLMNELEKNEPLINLASAEYSKAIDFKRIPNQVITPVFKEFKNGEYKVVMMYAKHARGVMTRYLVQKNINDIEQLKLYNVDGYSYDDQQSNSTEWVFIR